MTKTVFYSTIVLAFFLSGCSALSGQTTQLSQATAPWGGAPERGLRVTYVFPKSPAEAAGIHPMDVITKYGDFDVIDDAGFFAAKNHYDKPIPSTVEIVVFRGGYRMSAKVQTGWLGINSIDNDKVSQEFMRLMTRINTMREIPEYMHDREFKGQFVEGPAKILEKAKALIDEAERNQTLTPAQVQLYRIYMILDEASPEDQKRQADLLREFIASQPFNYVHMVGSDKFFKDKRYRAAIACFKEYLKRESGDVSIRLNMGFAYQRIGMYKEAAAATDYVLQHLNVSEYGEYVAYTTKAGAALGLKDYRNSIRFAEKSFSLDPKFYPMSIALLGAAQMGDLVAFDRSIQQFQEALPAKYIEMKLETDAVKAFALVKANQRDEARKLVRGWKDLDRAEGKVIGYWRDVPDGMDVANNWANLMKN